MSWVVLVGAALGVPVRLAGKQLLRIRHRREQESLGVKALYEEMDAALRSVNMAARNTDTRWVAGLSESRTLAETWLAHGPAFQRLDMARWEILDEAVKAVEPSSGLALVRPAVTRAANARGAPGAVAPRHGGLAPDARGGAPAATPEIGSTQSAT